MHNRRVDIAVWSSFFIFGCSSIAIPVSLKEMSDAFGMDHAQGGGLEVVKGLILAAALLGGGILGQRLGKKTCITAGVYLVGTGLCGIGLTQNYIQALVCTSIVGLGAGVIEALANPLVADHHPGDSEKQLNLANAFYPAGVLISVLVLGELIQRGVSWRAGFILSGIAGLIIGVCFSLTKIPVASAQAEEKHTFREILMRPAFWSFAGAIFFAAGAESSFTFWSARYIGLYFSEVPRAAALGIVAFSVFMLAGRVITIWLVDRVGLRVIMFASAILGILVSTGAFWTKSLPGIYAVLSLAGLATACFWPSILAEAERMVHAGTTLLFAMLAFVGVIGFGVTPWIIGILADATDLKFAFFLVAVVWFTALLAILILQRGDSSRGTTR